MIPPVSVTRSAEILAPALQPCLDGAGLPARWSGRPSFVVLDLAFGDGARFLATRQAWRDDPARPARLHYLALADGAMAALPADARPACLGAAAPTLAPGFQRIFFDGGQVVLDLMIGEAGASLAQLDARVDAFYLDRAALPIALPAAALARLAAAGATLCAPAPASATLRALAGAGFATPPTSVAAVDHGFAGLVFCGRRPQPARPMPRRRRAIVIGAGLAGAAACERLAARGWEVILIERCGQPAQQASGNLAGIFMPLLAADDNPAARLSRAALLFALRQWEQLGGVGTAFAGARCGVLQLARDPAHARVQRQIAAAGLYAPEFARWLEADAASALLGAPAADGGWWFGLGGWVHPAGVCQAMLDACGSRLTRLFSRSALSLRRDGDGDADNWLVLDAAGATIAAAPALILANGSGATAFAQAAGLPLAAVRGQVTHLAAGRLPAPPLVVCREAYMTPPSSGLASVGATYDADGDPGLRLSSQRANLARMAAILGVEAPEAPLAGRTGFRCVAPDRLPLVGALPNPAPAARQGRGPVERLRDVPRWPGLYGLLGYASRGLTWAPLAAELLAAQLEGEPAPLESSLAHALDPARYLLKELRRESRARPLPPE
ncbi:MAG TPA: FAD-dependent 5-carboxymethylaminomethyl-2-thiouridine(34) oxidoreductase MnmC [Janthinobacterium sp.]|nr:FAD-dependent 5-carboxymethylaminomethyl-2-thiouridine(34) oxidoreductase MnmC [Janthinobacterium sp.]